MIELKNLSVGYGPDPVVHQVTMSFPPGQITAILGPNGCGKSTLLKAIPGLSRILSGEILLDGQSISQFSREARARQAAYLPQTRRIPDMTAGQLVLHGRFPHLRYPRTYRREDREIAREAMERAGVLSYGDTPLNQLSGGIRQKVYIAMALAQNTPTIFLDEPNAYLDIAHQLQLMELCRDLARQGKAVVLVLHDLNLALGWADQIALMQEGRLVMLGDQDSLYQSGLLDQVFGVEVLRTRTPRGYHYSTHLPGKEHP